MFVENEGLWWRNCSVVGVCDATNSPPSVHILLELSFCVHQQPQGWTIADHIPHWQGNNSSFAIMHNIYIWVIATSRAGFGKYIDELMSTRIETASERSVCSKGFILMSVYGRCLSILMSWHWSFIFQCSSWHNSVQLCLSLLLLSFDVLRLKRVISEFFIFE